MPTYQMLAGGLVLTSMSDAYRDKLPVFYRDTFIEAYGEYEAHLEIWTRELLAPNHPAVTDEDVWFVIDPAKENKIVSALLLIPQTWRYEDVSLGVGRVELVATDKDYRNRGLIRAMMGVAHERSAALGHQIQVITGIPNYYRQFGYTMALKLGNEAFMPFAAIPKLKSDASPRYSLRPATTDDIPQLEAWYKAYAAHCLVSFDRQTHHWEYELTSRVEGYIGKMAYYIVQDTQGGDVGYIGLMQMTLYEDRVTCLDYVIGAGASYIETFDDVMRGIQAIALNYRPENPTPPQMIAFDNGVHPTLKRLIERQLGGSVRNLSYMWYVRAASPAQLIRHLAPVLERRLVGSGADSYSGSVWLNFYDKTGLRIKFEKGRMVEIVDEMPSLVQDTAGFPWHSFLNLVFGQNNIMELGRVAPDAFASRDTWALFEILFPVKGSWILGLY